MLTLYKNAIKVWAHSKKKEYYISNYSCKV
jgi:hypothetical protein